MKLYSENINFSISYMSFIEWQIKFVVIFDMNFLKRGKFKVFKSNTTIIWVYLFWFEFIRIQRVLFIKCGDISPVVKFFSDKHFSTFSFQRLQMKNYDK